MIKTSLVVCHRFGTCPNLRRKNIQLENKFLNEVFRHLTTWLPSRSRQMYPKNVINTMATMGLTSHNLYIFPSCKISMFLWFFLQLNDRYLYSVCLSKSPCFELSFCTLNSWEISSWLVLLVVNRRRSYEGSNEGDGKGVHLCTLQSIERLGFMPMKVWRWPWKVIVTNWYCLLIKLSRRKMFGIMSSCNLRRRNMKTSWL
jgi:hypothetical protein